MSAALLAEVAPVLDLVREGGVEVCRRCGARDPDGDLRLVSRQTGHCDECAQDALAELAGLLRTPVPTPADEPRPHVVFSPRVAPHQVALRYEWSIHGPTGEKLATTTVMRRLGYLWLYNVWTHPDHRRHGLASLIIERVAAHFQGEELHVLIEPYTDRALTERELACWYERRGFRMSGTAGVMVRRPPGWEGAAP